MKTPVSYLEAKDRLSGEYLETFEHIESYCQTEFITEDDLEDRMGYLLDIFLSAQKDKVSVSAITGGSVKSFCKNFMSDCASKSVVTYIAEILKRVSWVTVAFSVIGMVMELMTGSGSVIPALTQNSGVSTCIIISLIIAIVSQVISSVVIRSFIFRVKKYRAVYHKAVNVIVSVAMFAGMFLIAYSGFSLGIPNIFALIAAVVYIIGYYTVRGVNNRKLGRSFFFSNADNFRKTSFSQKVHTAMVGEFRDLYAKQNAKRVRKGQQEMTHDEFIQKLEKDNKTAKISTIVCVVSLAAIYISNMISMMLESTVTDALAYAVVLLAVLTLVYFLVIHSLVVYPYFARKKFFEILKKNEKTVFDEDVYDCINAYYNE